MNKQGKIQLIEIFCIFTASIVIYLSNGVTIAAGDTIPNSLLAFNLLENHTLNFDNFRNTFHCTQSYGNCSFFIEGINRHLTSIYPIGTAIVTFPLYVIFYAYIKLLFNYGGVTLDLTSSSFEIYRLFFEKLAATITTAISIVIFYLSLRLKFTKIVSLVSTLIFAFATNTWMTSSQGLWQHTASNLALIIAIFSLLKANRASEKNQILWLVVAGITCGLLPGIRPTSTLYTIAAIIYSIFTYRYQSLFLLLGLVSALPSIAWNLYYFGNFTGGYSRMFSTLPYEFTLSHFINASLGTLISPSRGLLIFSPIVLYCLPGTYKVFQARSGKDEKLIGCMTFCALILLFNYFFYVCWWAGDSYGARFTTDILPITCYLIAYCMSFNLKKNIIFQLNKLYIIIFITVLIFSTFTQFVGSFGAKPGALWYPIPLNIDNDENHYRFWSLRDSSIERNAKAVFHKIIKPPIEQPAYIQGLSGKIKQVIYKNNQPLNSSISVKPGSEEIIRIKLENTGLSKWFGYESALEKGEVRVRGRFYDENNKQVSEVRLYVSGTPKQYESTEAIASVTFPKEAGIYKLVFDLISEAVGEFPNSTGKPLYELNINVGNQQQKKLQLPSVQIFSQEIKILNKITYLKVDSMYNIPFLLKNTSNFIWSNTERNPTNFSYRWLDINGKVVIADGERTALPFNLSPGESAAINAIIKTPSQPGKYTLALSMVQESVTWFSDKQADFPKFEITITPNIM